MVQNDVSIDVAQHTVIWQKETNERFSGMGRGRGLEDLAKLKCLLSPVVAIGRAPDPLTDGFGDSYVKLCVDFDLAKLSVDPKEHPLEALGKLADTITQELNLDTPAKADQCLWEFGSSPIQIAFTMYRRMAVRFMQATTVSIRDTPAQDRGR